MRYPESTMYTLKYVSEMLGEDEDFLLECSIEMFPEDGCFNAINSFPVTELTEPIVVFTEAGIENLRYIITHAKQSGAQAHQAAV